MQNVKNILDSLLQPSIHKEAWKINLIKNWPTIIGSLHEKVSLQKINATSVVIGVYDSCWIQELYLLSKLILKKINSSLDRPRIETLRFQCIEKKELVLKKQAPAQEQQLKRALNPKESLALQKIHDPQLYAALQTLLQRCKP
jgi:Dna[CI] antecedent, DciA